MSRDWVLLQLYEASIQRHTYRCQGPSPGVLTTGRPQLCISDTKRWASWLHSSHRAFCHIVMCLSYTT